MSKRSEYSIDNIVNNLKKKLYLYFIHMGNTGGMYLKKQAFKDEPRVQWYGKGRGKYDHHPCGLTTPVVFEGSRNNSKTYASDPLFLDPRSLKFSIVRNPFDLYVSLYFISQEQIGKMTFEDFIKMTCCDPNFRPNIAFGESFVLSRNFLFYQIFNDLGNSTVDVILKNEHLNDGIEALCKQLDITCSLVGSSKNPPKKWQQYRAQRGVPKSRDYRTFYTDELVDIIKKKRGRELKAFRYDFEGCTDDELFVDPATVRYKIYEDEFTIAKKNTVSDI